MTKIYKVIVRKRQRTYEEKNYDVMNDVIHMVSNIWPLDGSSGNVGKRMAAKWGWFKTSVRKEF